MKYFQSVEYEEHACFLELVKYIHLGEDHHGVLLLDVGGVQLLHQHEFEDHAGLLTLCNTFT